MTPITIAPVAGVNAAATPVSKVPGSFAAVLQHALTGVSQSQAHANQAIAAAMTGKTSVTAAMVAVTEAQASLDVTTAVRNNVVQAYQTIMNMPLS